MIKHEHIHIFKTNITTNADKEKLQTVFGTSEGIHEWSVDLDDVDCVLRVISPSLSREKITEIVSRTGYNCAELM
jgi:hypothetical protein